METQENNGCIGHPVTNLLMAGVVREKIETALGQFTVDDGTKDSFREAVDAVHDAVSESGAEELPPEVLADIEAAFEDMAGKVETAVRQVRDTDERTAHLVITCERLARGMVDAHEKLDRIMNHFKVA